MKVKELIELLNRVDKDLPVYVCKDETPHGETCYKIEYFQLEHVPGITDKHVNLVIKDSGSFKW